MATQSMQRTGEAHTEFLQFISLSLQYFVHQTATMKLITKFNNQKVIGKED